MFEALAKIQKETISARTRTGDKTIATRVKAGKFQIVKVTYNAKGKASVTSVSDFADAESTINSLKSI